MSKQCYNCHKAVSMDEIMDVEHRIENLDDDKIEKLAGHFTDCHGPQTMFHNSDAGSGIVNCCRACFDSILSE